MSGTTWQLEHLHPRHRRGETFVLEADRPDYSIGRSARCDIRLSTATASREHAWIRRSEDGSWWVVSMSGRSVTADGAPTQEPVELCDGLSLELGGDRLRCRRVEESLAGGSAPGPAARATAGRLAGRGRWIGLMVALAVLAAGLVVALIWRPWA